MRCLRPGRSIKDPPSNKAGIPGRIRLGATNVTLKRPKTCYESRLRNASQTSDSHSVAWVRFRFTRARVYLTKFGLSYKILVTTRCAETGTLPPALFVRVRVVEFSDGLRNESSSLATVVVIRDTPTI